MREGIHSVREAPVAGKRVLLRVDFNVPLDTARGAPRGVNDLRIRSAPPPIQCWYSTIGGPPLEGAPRITPPRAPPRPRGGGWGGAGGGKGFGFPPRPPDA